MSTPNLTAIDFSKKKDGKKDDFKLTPDEAKRLEEKMKDPEFMKLWVEYAQSLADPKVREEEEQYLREVEERAKNEGDDSFDFIFPKPGYAIELLACPDAKKGHRVGVNMCSSEKIEPFREETTGDRWGSHWYVPVSVGVGRTEPKAYDNSDWEVYDAVFHPQTIELASRSDKFMVFLTEIAVENINGGYKRRFDFKFNRLPSSVPCIGGQPKNQTVRRSENTNKPNQAANGNGAREVSLGPIKASFDETEVQKRTKVVGGNNNNNNNNSNSASASAAAVPPKIEKNTGNIKMSVLHRGEIDLTDAWNWSKLDKRIGIPKELVLRAQLPTIERASELDVDIVKGLSVEISCPAKKLQGAMLLDFTVEETPVSAKFERTKKELTLVLKVVPPPAPPSAVMPEEEKKVDNINSNDEEETNPASSNGKNDEEDTKKTQQQQQKPAAPTAEELEQKNEKVKQAYERLQQQQKDKEKKEQEELEAEKKRKKEDEEEKAKQKQQQEEQNKIMRERQEAWLKEEEERKNKIEQEKKQQQQQEKEKEEKERQLQKQKELEEAEKKLKKEQELQKQQQQQQQKEKENETVSSSSNLLLIDDDDDDFKPKQSDADSKKQEAILREAAKKSADAQRQEEVMQAELDKKMKQLPLTNGFIFAID